MNDSMSPDKPINVLTVGMDRRKQAMFRMAFEMHTLHRYQLLEQPADGKPQLAIVDFDTPDASGLWTMFREEHPTLPALIVTTAPPAAAPAPVLLKPIKLESLFPRLRELLSGEAFVPPAEPPPPSVTAPTATPVAAQPAPQAARAPAPPPAEHAWPERIERFDPRIGLLGALLKLKRAQQDGIVSIAGMKALLVLPDKDRVILFQPEDALREACTSPTILVASRPPSPEDPLDGEAQSLSSLLWKVSLWTSRGRLLAGFPENGAVHLRHWPNLTRLSPTPNGLRIAAFWVRSPTSLPLTLRMLNVPPQEMFDFLAASYSIGILEIPKGQAKPQAKYVTEAELEAKAPAPKATPAPTPGPAEPEAPKPAGGLLSRLLRKVAGL